MPKYESFISGIIIGVIAVVIAVVICDFTWNIDNHRVWINDVAVWHIDENFQDIIDSEIPLAVTDQNKPGIIGYLKFTPIESPNKGGKE